LAFINDHLIPQVPPPLDGSESSRRYLNYRYPVDQGPVLESTDKDIVNLVAEYHAKRKVIRELTFEETKIENLLKSIIGDAAGMRGEWGKIYWKKNKDSQKVNWEALAKTFNPDSELVDHFTIVKPGARVFRAYFAKED
jgi:predicted phage-related endonuclease